MDEWARTCVPGRQRIAELDGFRAIAVLSVLIHHAFYGYRTAPGTLESLPALFTFVVSRGWLGVDLFFVLSGLLITGILLDSKARPGYFKNFYARRILRILPVYLVVLGICALVYSGYRTYFLLSLGMLANFAGAFQAPIPHGPGVYWSLAVEEHFYLLWPLLVFLLRPRILALLAATIVVGTPILRGLCALNGMDPELQIYVYSWFRFDGLALGALIAIWLRSPWSERRRSLAVAAGLVVLSSLITVGGTPFGLMGTKTVASAALRYTQVQLIFAAAILASLAMVGTFWTAPLRSRFARITGNYSYCIYLIHLALGDAYLAVLGWLGWSPVSWLGGVGALGLQVLVIGVASYALAAVSFRVLEQPFLRLKSFFEMADETRASTRGRQMPQAVEARA